MATRLMEAVPAALSAADEAFVEAVLRLGQGGKMPTLKELAEAAGYRGPTPHALEQWAHVRMKKPAIRAAIAARCRNRFYQALPGVTDRLIKTAMTDRGGMARNVAATMILDRTGLGPLGGRQADEPGPEFEIIGVENVPPALRPRSAEDAIGEDPPMISWQPHQDD